MEKLITTLTKKEIDIILMALQHSINTCDWDLETDKPAAELFNYFLDIQYANKNGS
jgi:hypothetical protein